MTEETCDWCGEPIGEGETAVFVVEAENSDPRTKIDPSWPRATLHPGICADEALEYGFE